MCESVQPLTDRFFAALMRVGMPEIAVQFSVVPCRQIIPAATLTGIDSFLSIFDRVSTSPVWQRATVAHAPAIARHPRSERCFFDQPSSTKRFDPHPQPALERVNRGKLHAIDLTVLPVFQDPPRVNVLYPKGS